ncbi:MAG: DUF6049 family protein [Actinomycetes bacterium]
MRRLVTALLVTAFLLTPIGYAQAASVNPHNNLRPIGVRILTGSKINLVSHESKLPIAISNDFDTEVRVIVNVRPNTLQVVMPSAVEITIPAQTTVNAKIPITATSDGDVIIDAWLTTFSGLKFGRVVKLQVAVNEDVELYLILGFGSLVGFLIVIGVIRTMRRKTIENQVTA